MKRKLFRLILLIMNMSFVFQNIISQDFEIAPVKIFFEAEPGQTQSMPLSILNHSNHKQAYILELSDFIVNKEGEHISMPAASTEHSLVNWISINPPFIELNPNESRQVLISIQAPSGDYTTKWVNVYVKATSEQTAFNVDKGTQTGLVLSPQIVVQVHQSPKSNINYKMKVGNFVEITAPGDTVRTYQVTVDNMGDKISQCKITLLASDLSTGKEYMLTNTQFTSYPDAQLIKKLPVKKKLPVGKYALAAILDYGSKTNLEGAQLVIEVE
jgi:hypothetical protein